MTSIDAKNTLLLKTQEIYHILSYRNTGDCSFTSRDLPSQYTYILQHLAKQGFLTQLTRKHEKQRAVYRISNIYIKRFQADKILGDPEILQKLATHEITIRELSRLTGYSDDTIRRKISQLPEA
jgi:DNA-binding PadR family transcriptional regulator